MPDIGDRILQVIKSKEITKTKFAEQLNLSQAYVSQLTTQGKTPSDRTITDICREFNVNETWLRTGEGEMMVPRTDEEKITEFLDDVLTGKPDIRRRLISALARLDPEDWDLIERMIDKIAGDEKEAAPE